MSAGDVNDKTLLMASASKKKKKKPLFKQVTTTRSEFTPGNVSLTVPLSGAGKSLLAQQGKLKAQIKVIYTPKSGVSGSQVVKVKLKGKGK